MALFRENIDVENYGFFGRLAYQASFGLSYGVVYPFALVARVIPKENSAVYGLTDGAAAARDEAFGLGRSSATPEIGHHDAPMVAEPA